MANELKFGNPIVVGSAASDPATGYNGEIYYNTTSSAFRIFAGGSWSTLATGSVSLTGQALNDNNVIVGNGSNVSAAVDSSSVGDVLVDPSTGLTLKAGVITNSEISASAAIGLSKLAALTVSRAVVSDGSGVLSVSATTSAQIGFLSNVTSDVQAQIAAKLSLSGGTMSGAIAMGTNKITGLGDPVSAQDAMTLHYAGITYIPLADIGAVNGVASLDGAGKVPVSQLPSAVMEYQGSWNPSTNTPTLADGTGTNGNVYYVTAAAAGPVSGLADPSMHNFQIGDLIIFSSTVSAWQLVTPAAGVMSVNGAQGAVTVNAINQLTGDVTAGPASGSASAAATIAAGAVTATKLGSVTDGVTLDQSASGSKLEVKTGGISDLQIAAAAAIALTKLAALTANRIVVTNGSGFLTDNASGDVAVVSTSVSRGASGSALITEKYVDATTLTDNTASPTSITALTFDHTVYAGVEISYTLESNPGTPAVRIGTLRLSSTSTATSISDTFTDTAELGVTFSAVISGANTAVAYTTTSIGANRTLRADMKLFRL